MMKDSFHRHEYSFPKDREQQQQQQRQQQTQPQNQEQDEFTVDSADVIRLILGYLTLQGLHTSAQVLRRESGIGFQSHQCRLHPDLPNQIRQGDWGNVLQALQLSESSSSTTSSSPSINHHALLQEQVILELSEQPETLSMAYHVLKVARDDLDQIMEDDGDADDDEDEDGEKDGHKTSAKRKNDGSSTLPKLSKARSLEQKLAALAGNPNKYPPNSPSRLELLYGKKSNKKEKRQQLANAMEQQPIIPLNRLPILLQQAMKWQSFTGQLPWIQEAIHDNNQSDGNNNNKEKKKRKKRKRKHLDLVLGTAVGDRNAIVGEDLLLDNNDDDEDGILEPVPTDVWTKVKFGKSAVCEAAVFLNVGLITASSDGLIEIWDSSYQDLNTTDYPYQSDSVMGHDNDNGRRVLSLALSNDQTLLASGDTHGLVKIWKLASGQCLRQYQAHNQSVTCLALTRDASRILTASADGTCREFGMITQHVLQEYIGHSSYIHSCHYHYISSTNDMDDIDNNDGSAKSLWVVTSSADGTVRLWHKGQSIRILQPKPTGGGPNNVFSSLVVDSTNLSTECPAIPLALPIPSSNQLLVVPRSLTAYLVDWDGTVLQRYQADPSTSSSSSSSDVTPTCFCAATISHSFVYLCTNNKDCWIFHLKKGTLYRTISNFAVNSTYTTSTTATVAEITQVLHHPFKPVLAAFSNDKMQKKGILTVWK